MMPELNLRVEGHTDNTGSDTLNQKLSEDRAEGVVLLLKTQGISASRQKSEGYGPRRPAATNDTKEGRAKNRRVEIVIAEGEIKAAPGN
jgi:outer membrane protein OmpA-like peptidoglycan-associated protein